MFCGLHRTRVSRGTNRENPHSTRLYKGADSGFAACIARWYATAVATGAPLSCAHVVCHTKRHMAHHMAIHYGLDIWMYQAGDHSAGLYGAPAASSDWLAVRVES